MRVGEWEIYGKEGKGIFVVVGRARMARRGNGEKGAHGAAVGGGHGDRKWTEGERRVGGGAFLFIF